MTHADKRADKPIDMPRWLRLSALVYVPLALLGGVWIVLRDGVQGLHAGLVGPAPLRDVTIGIGAALAVVMVGQLLGRVWRGAHTLEVAMARLTGRLTMGECVLLALFSGLGEEILFRAGMQPTLGLVATSILFGLLHFPFQRALLLWTPFAIGMGFLLGALYEIDGCAVAPATAHVTVNALNLHLLQKHWLPGGALRTEPSALEFALVPGPPADGEALDHDPIHDDPRGDPTDGDPVATELPDSDSGAIANNPPTTSD